MSRGIKLPRDPSEWGFKGKNYLFVIGIDQYEHWKPLNNAVKDVTDIADVLTARYQFEPDHVIMIVDGEATEDGIRKALIDVKRKITSDDNLIVCFSGHGHYDEDLEEGYWVPVDAQKAKPSDYISNSDLLKWIRSIQTHHTLVLVDACFSGTLVTQSRSEVLSERFPSSRIFASGRNEVVDDGVAGENSPFAQAILGKLQHNNDRVLRASDVISHVFKSVEAKKGQVPIEGRIKDASDEGGEFVFHLKATEEEIWKSVMAHDTADEYRRYCEFFPDGTYREEAESRIRQLTDDAAWKEASRRNTADSLTGYLESHPEGKHYDKALEALNTIEEETAWQSTRTKGTLGAYLEFLRRFPNSGKSKEAKRQINLLKSDQESEARSDIEREIEEIKTAAKDEEGAKDVFKELLQAAETAFNKEQFDLSIAKFEEAIQKHQPSFVPGVEYLRERISDARKGIDYLELFNDGKEAAKSGNFELAIQYFKKAKSYNNSARINDWIKHCEQKLLAPEPDLSRGPDDDKKPKPPPVKPVKKKRRRGLLIGLILFAILAVVVIIAAVMEEIDRGKMDNTYQDIYNNYDEPASKGGTYTGVTANDLIGTWIVSRRVVSGATYDNPGIQMIMMADGGYTVYAPNGTGVGNWSFRGNVLTQTTTPFGIWSGQVTNYTGDSFTWQTTEVINGYSYSVTSTLYRQY